MSVKNYSSISCHSKPLPRVRAHAGYDPDRDQDKPVEEQANQTLGKKVEPLQESMREMGIVSDGSDDKAFMPSKSLKTLAGGKFMYAPYDSG